MGQQLDDNDDGKDRLDNQPSDTRGHATGLSVDEASTPTRQRGRDPEDTT